MKEIKLRYTEPLLREAVRAFLFRAITRGFGLRFFVAWVALAVCVAYLWAQGDRSWLVGVFAAALLMVVVMFAAIYIAHIRNTVGRFQKMKVPEATFSCTEEDFTLTSELGTATFPWSTITEVWRFPRFWLILYSSSQFSTLPLDCLDEEMQAFITRKTDRS